MAYGKTAGYPEELDGLSGPKDLAQPRAGTPRDVWVSTPPAALDHSLPSLCIRRQWTGASPGARLKQTFLAQEKFPNIGTST